MDESEYEQFQKECEKIASKNMALLSGFANSLLESGLSQTTIQEHVDNIDMYINTFLLYERPIEAQKGASELDDFFSYWFPRKALWSSPGSVRSTAASLKKFYSYLHSKGLFAKEELEELKQEIKESMPLWLEKVSY